MSDNRRQDKDQQLGETAGRQRLVVITGPAGAGRQTAIHALEDFGLESIDNLPLGLLPRLLSGPAAARPIAVGIDARTRGFSAEALLALLEDLRMEGRAEATLVFLDCRVDVLIRRYTETRRRHPLSPSDTPRDGIERDRILLDSLKNRADILIDTSDLAPQELRAELARWFSEERQTQLSVSVQSFSYKRGTPRGIDMVIDCRFLQNPHWVPALRPLDGRDQPVADYIAADPSYQPFLDRLLDLTLLLLPAYQAEGKSYFSLGLGCTGGRHRSVCIAETVAKSLAGAGWQVSTQHREIGRAAQHSAADLGGVS